MCAGSPISHRVLSLVVPQPAQEGGPVLLNTFAWSFLRGVWIHEELGAQLTRATSSPSKERWRPSTIPWSHLPRLTWIAPPY